MVEDRVEEVHALNTYSVENVPGIVAVSLKRFDDQLCKINSEVLNLLNRNVKRFRGGLVLKAHRLVYHSILGSRVSKKPKTQSRDLHP